MAWSSIEWASASLQTRLLQQLGAKGDVECADANQDDQHRLIAASPAIDPAGHDICDLAGDPAT